jgi:hypothetical protein
MRSHFLRRGCAIPILFAIATVCSGQAPLPEPVTDQETELGLAVYNELKAKGEIVETSPLYDTLRPIADAITRVAQSRYTHHSNSSSFTNPTPMRLRRPAVTSTSSILCSIS